MAKTDTVTPLDGDGAEDNSTPVVDLAASNVAEEDYKTNGTTTVATRPGFRFVPSNEELPVVTSKGVKMTQKQADEVVAQSHGRVHIVTEKKED